MTILFPRCLLPNLRSIKGSPTAATWVVVAPGPRQRARVFLENLGFQCQSLNPTVPFLNLAASFDVSAAAQRRHLVSGTNRAA